MAPVAKQHNWKQSWPGNFCLDCGLDDPFEDTDKSLINCPIFHAEGLLEIDCEKCLGTGCVVNPDLVIPPCTKE